MFPCEWTYSGLYEESKEHLYRNRLLEEENTIWYQVWGLVVGDYLLSNEESRYMGDLETDVEEESKE